MCCKYWIMMDYGNTKKYRMKINNSIVRNRIINIDWLILADSLISTYLTR